MIVSYLSNVHDTEELWNMAVCWPMNRHHRCMKEYVIIIYLLAINTKILNIVDAITYEYVIGYIWILLSVRSKMIYLLLKIIYHFLDFFLNLLLPLLNVVWVPFTANFIMWSFNSIFIVANVKYSYTFFLCFYLLFAGI